jgi:uncharacterized repeat protein (TIGR01451 family)
MSMARPLSKTAGLLLALILAVPAFPQVASVIGYTDNAGNVDAKLLSDFGAAAPYGAWQKATEPTTVYLHSNCDTGNQGDPTNGGMPVQPEPVGACGPNPPAVPPPVGPLPPPAPQTLYMDTEYPNWDTAANPCTAGSTTPPSCGDSMSLGVTETGPALFSNSPFQAPNNCPADKSLGVLADTTVYSLSANFYGTGDVNTPTTLSVAIYDYDANCNRYPSASAGPFATMTLNPNTVSTTSSVRQFKGDVSIGQQGSCATAVGANGYCLKEGHHVWLTVTTSSEATLEFDSAAYPSSLTIVADSVRSNLWTTDRFNHATADFPGAASSSNLDRNVKFHGAEFDTFGNNEISAVCVNGKSTPPDKANQCYWDNLDETAMRLRIRDVSPEHTAANGWCGGTAGTLCYNKILSLDLTLGLRNGDGGISDSYLGCCNNLPSYNAVQYSASASEQSLGLGLYSYNLLYGSGFPKGDFRIELEENNKAWAVDGVEGFYTLFHVGRTGFTFQFNGEPAANVNPDLTVANHTVALNQPTKYTALITNTGYASDTYGVSVDAPGFGWTAVVSPNLVTLVGGNSAKVDVIVTPPATAHAGDAKIVAARAVALSDSTTKAVFTRTTLTADTTCPTALNPPQHPVERLVCLTLSTSVTKLETRPHLDKYFAVQLHNLETIRDNFVMSTSGAPAGWVVNISPPYLGVYAQSQETVAVHVLAPTTALGGTSFTLMVKACRTSNGTVCATLPVPVEVFAIHDITLSVLGTPGQIGDTINFRDAEQDLFDCTHTDTNGICATVNEDNKFDDSALFRLNITNGGDTPDVVDLTGAWAPPTDRDPANPVAITDSAGCDGAASVNYDGTPDGWRFRFLANSPGGAFTPADPGPTFPQPNSATPVPPFFTPDPGFTGTPTGGNAVNRVGSSNKNVAFSGDMHMGTLALPAHTSHFMFLEMYWVAPGGAGCAGEPCGGDQNSNACDSNNYRPTVPSPTAQLRVSWRSVDDPTLRGKIWPTAKLDSATRAATVNSNGDHNPANDPVHNVHFVKLERAAMQPDLNFAPLTSTTPWATYNMMATNTGMEYDTLKVSVDDGHNGWKHTIQVFDVGQSTGIVTGKVTSDPNPAWRGKVSGGVPARPTPNCSFNSPVYTVMVCQGIGVFDTVYFQVRAAPPSTAHPGDYDDMSVTVSSGRGEFVGNPVSDRITVRTIAQGLYGFLTDNPNGNLLAYPKQTIAFPFSIQNVGTSSDHYILQLDTHIDPNLNAVNPSNDGWNEQFSSGPVVAVPAALTWHGFLSVTVPANATLTSGVCNGPCLTADHFRIRIQSLDSPARTTQVLDFFAPVEEEPAGLTITADPAGIASGASGPIQLHATGDGLKALLVNGYYLQAPPGKLPPLPRGYSFTCLNNPTVPCTRDEVQALPEGITAWKGTWSSVPTYQPGDGVMDATATPKEWVAVTANNNVPPTATTPEWRLITACSLGPDASHRVAPKAAPNQCTPDYMVQVPFPTVSGGISELQNELDVQVPPGELGTSRVAHRLNATGCSSLQKCTPGLADGPMKFVDAIINLRSTYGVELNTTDGITHRVLPPTPARLAGSPLAGAYLALYNVTIVNPGLTNESVLLTNSALPPGWDIVYDTQALTVASCPNTTDANGNPTQVGYCQAPGYALLNGPNACTTTPGCNLIDPASSHVVQIGLRAPPACTATDPPGTVCSNPGDLAIVTIFGTVQEDTNEVAHITLTARVGQYGVDIKQTSPATLWVGPQDVASFIVTLTNNGTLPDTIDVRGLLPPGLAFNPNSPDANFAIDYHGCDSTKPVAAGASMMLCVVNLDANETFHQTKTVSVDVLTPNLVAPTGATDPGYTIGVSAMSESADSPTSKSVSDVVKILAYKAADVDNDLLPEYAVDGCTKSQVDGCAADPSDGFETFTENLGRGCAGAASCGVVSQEAPLSQYLSDDARQAKADAGELRGDTYFIDADGSGKAAHFIDVDADGFPDVLWVPSGKAGNVVDRLNFTRDVTADGVPDYFIDLTGSGRWTEVFDIVQGKFIPVLQKFVNSDTYVDYVVDSNGNGALDDGETILFGGPGGAITSVQQRVDVDGDGVLDAVISDATGKVAYFVPGSCLSANNQNIQDCAGIPIVLRDVTHDGRDDWTYDSSGKAGTPDMYYDPYNHVTGKIDTKSAFVEDLLKYWYVEALFGVALALFVVLVIVTRRRR